MDTITIKDKLYEKSILVAKRYGYTVDYLGQLARSGKIDSKLVGRSRYVYAPSVEEYQKQLSEQDKEVEHSHKKVDKKSLHIQNSRQTIKDPESFSVPLHRVHTRTHLPSIQTEKATPSIAKYYSDEEVDLIPVIKSRQAEDTKEFHHDKKLNIMATRTISVTSSEGSSRKNVNTDTLAGSEKSVAVNSTPFQSVKSSTSKSKTTNENFSETEKKLKIHSYSANFSIINPQLPKVRLRGKLKVGSGDGEVFSTAEPVSKVRSIQNYFDDTDRSSSRIDNDTSDRKNSSTTYLVSKETSNRHVRPESDTKRVTSFSYTPESVRAVSKGRFHISYMMLFFCLFVLVVAAGIVFIESQTVFIGETGLSATTWRFNLPW